MNFLNIVLSLLLQCLLVYSTKKINVLISKTDSFVENSIGKRALERLELKIIENFGIKFKKEIEYIVANETLNEIFSREDRSETFHQSIRHS